MSDTQEEVKPFLQAFNTAGLATLHDAARWLSGLSPRGAEAGEALYTRFEEDIDALCGRWGANVRPAPNESASLHYSRPVFLHLLRVGKGTSRGGSLWRVYYDVLDTDKDGKPDTLRVLSVVHGAARPLWEVDRENEEEPEDE